MKRKSRLLSSDRELIRERRLYIRLDSVFPVEFRLISSDGISFLSDWIQGFTHNVSKGGLCLNVNNLKPEIAKIIKSGQGRLSLKIEMPLNKKPIVALSSVAWTQEASVKEGKYLVGLSYENIENKDSSRIIHYARFKKIFFPAAISLIIILALGFGANSYINYKLIKGNKALIEQLVRIVQESSIAKQKIKAISREKEDLLLKIQSLEQGIKNVAESKDAESKATKKAEELNGLIERMAKEKDYLQEQLIALQNKENIVTEDLLRLDKIKVNLEKSNLDKMYKWLKVHQNHRTGLVMSFEGDDRLDNWGFIYDQSLVAQAYTNFSDFDRAKKILEFFDKKAKRIGGLFINAYYTTDGDPAEYTIHSGPNIWLGLAAVHYVVKSNDSSYLKLAEDIAKQIINLQNQDVDGGIRGGPTLDWYSTEHNLDAYAFFKMLYKVTSNPIYSQAQDKALNWLRLHTYDKHDVPIKRGKGDSTIATDTYAWSIAAIGPEKLEEIGMNPDMILEFAEQNCSVAVDYTRPGGKTVKIKGFDFAAQRHIARGGVCSSEWTAQMVMAFKIMADFCYKKGMIAKARVYKSKADEYMMELANMIISSPSPSGQGESCLPYATSDFVDTGHGWMTPKGNCTGSVAGTAYTLFAYYKYNPLQLEE